MSVLTISAMWRTWPCTDGGGEVAEKSRPGGSSWVLVPATALATDMRLESRPTGHRFTEDDGEYFSL